MLREYFKGPGWKAEMSPMSMLYTASAPEVRGKSSLGLSAFKSDSSLVSAHSAGGGLILRGAYHDNTVKRYESIRSALTKNSTEACVRKISYRVHVREPYGSINYVKR